MKFIYINENHVCYNYNRKGMFAIYQSRSELI